MSTMHVYLADLPSAIRSPAPLRRRIQHHFDMIVDYAANHHLSLGGIKTIKVEYSRRAPALKPNDLLVYFVDGIHDSVIKGLLKQNAGPSQKITVGGTTLNLGASAKGNTLTGNSKGNCSEVYISRSVADLLPNMAFHELMHNTCMLGHGLHSQPGVLLGKAAIRSDWQPSAGDLRLMCRHLNGAHRQWTGGYKSWSPDPMSFPSYVNPGDWTQKW